MIRRAATTVLVVAVSISVSFAWPNVAVDRLQDQPSPKSEPKQKAEPQERMTSLTGCVDEQEGKWVLVNDQTMAIIAGLTADGFPTEGFAKYLGQKVNVRGTASSGAPSPAFRVREIKRISETCTTR